MSFISVKVHNTSFLYIEAIDYLNWNMIPFWILDYKTVIWSLSYFSLFNAFPYCRSQLLPLLTLYSQDQRRVDSGLALNVNPFRSFRSTRGGLIPKGPFSCYAAFFFFFFALWGFIFILNAIGYSWKLLDLFFYLYSYLSYWVFPNAVM